MANKTTLLFILIALMAVSGACIKEDHFGRSNRKTIDYFTLTDQSSSTRIDPDSLAIFIKVDPNADITHLHIDSVSLSTFATIEPGKDVVRDFSTPQRYTVKAEDGSTAIYTVYVSPDSPEPQLENTDFDDWYTPLGKSYKEPGLDSTSIWATANSGVTFPPLPQSNANTLPQLIAGNDFAAKLITKELGGFALAGGQGMASATLYTGKFKVNISDPNASTQFGIPFSARPKAFTVELSYVAGTPYEDGKHNVLNKIDSGEVYVVLENRQDQNNVKRVATGWYRMGTTSGSGLNPITVNLIYGPLSAGTPDYQKPANGSYASANDKVTHISVVYASSVHGDIYEGGVNSTLTVNRFRLIY